MEQYLIWKVLGIEETDDEDMIRQAYREKLSGVNPEEDQAGFMRLREAYEQAIEYVRGQQEQSDDMEELKNGDEVDRFIYRIYKIYEDIEKRRNPAKWLEVFQDEVCDGLDSEVPERLLVFIMSHHYMPMAVWKAIDDKFHYVEDMAALKEKFPEDFLNYVKYKTGHEEFIDFTIFSGDTSDHVDDYLNKYFDLKAMVDQGAVENQDKISGAIKALEDYNVYYPYVDAEKLRYFYLTDPENRESEILELADSLYEEYGENQYIAYYCGEACEKCKRIEKAEEIWKKILVNEPDHYMAKYGMAKIMSDRGELAEAKEYCLDLLDVDDRSQELREFLDSLNKKLIDLYTEQLKGNEDDFPTTNKLAWCHFQMQDYKKVEDILNHVPEKYREEYDYINLIGRNYLAMDDYDNAMKYLPRWQKMIEETEDDGSKEAHKRLNRKGFSYFAIGFCQWNQNLIPEATENLFKSFELEKQLNAKLSYMDQMAQFYLDAGSYDQAIDMCTRIVTMDRNYYPSYVRRQQAYFEKKNGQGVIDDFYECIRLYQGYVKPYVLAYKTFYFYRQYEDAAGILKRVKEAGLESDELKLYQFKIQRATMTGREHWLKTLEEVTKFKEEYFAKKNEREKDGEKEENQTVESDLEDPEELFMEIALLHWNVDDTDAALKAVDEGISLYGDKTGLVWLKADIFMDLEKYQEALGLYRRIMDEEGQSPGIHINVGKCLDKIGQMRMNDKAEDALREYEKAYEINPRHSEVNFLIMRIYKRKFVYRGEKEAYEKAIFHANAQLEISEDAYYYIERGLIYEEGHELDRALADFLEAARLEPDNIYAHNNAGNICRKLRKFDLALQEFETAMKLPNENQNVWVYSNMAELLETMGEYDKALEYMLKQVKAAPNSRYLLENLARQYEKAGKFGHAISTYEKLRKLGYLRDYELSYNIAGCHYLAGSNVAAKKHYLKAISLAKKEGDGLLECYDEYGDFCRDTGRFKEALEAYEKCFSLADKQDNFTIRNRTMDIAEVYYEMDRKEKAAEYAKKYLDMTVEAYGSLEKRVEENRKYCPARAYSIAMCLMMTGDLEGAEKYQQIVMRSYQCNDCHHGKCFEAYYGEGLIMEAAGNFLRAIELMKEALEIKGDYPECKRALQRVMKKAKKH